MSIYKTKTVLEMGDLFFLKYFSSGGGVEKTLFKMLEKV